MCNGKGRSSRRKARPRAFPKKLSCSLCLCGEFPLRRLKRKMPRPSKSVRRGRGGRRFHHRGTESTKICRAEEEPRDARTAEKRVLGHPIRKPHALSPVSTP